MGYGFCGACGVFPSYAFLKPSSKRAGQMVTERLALLTSANKWSLLLPLPRKVRLEPTDLVLPEPAPEG